jgi:hypothetical protein
MTLAGSQEPSSIRGGQKLPGIVNYFIGNDPAKWHTRIPTYSEVDYAGVYPGVDLVYRAAGKNLEFDFQVAPGADPSRIRMAYAGASKMHLNAAGDLILDTNAGPASMLKPRVYQNIDNQRVTVAANYRMLENGEVGFKLGKYDRHQVVVIDPTALIGPSVYYSTYLGSGSGDTFSSIAVDAAGEAFICGSTSQPGYPTSASAYQGTFPIVYYDDSITAGFVTALNATGTGIIYSTYIAGTSSSADIGVSLNGIAVDATGFAFVGGQTDDATFPVMKAFQSTISGGVSGGISSGVVFELSQTGSSLVYSSFLGGSDPDNNINAIAVDGSDNAYVAGNIQTGNNGGSGNPHSSNFPVTTGVIWGHYNQMDLGAGFDDAVAAKIAPPTGGNATLAYSTVIGSANTGGEGTSASAIAVDSNGNAYITGTTYGDIGDHGGTITTTHSMTHASPTQGEYAPTVWVLELNSGATAAVYLDYLGGSTPSGMYSPQNTVAGIQVDSNFLAYVAGTTEANNFQTTSGAHQPSSILAGTTYNGDEQSDGFVTVIAAGGASFTYSTYLNGNTISSQQQYGGSPVIAGIALGTGGQFAVAGLANTTNFPLDVPTSPGGTPLLSAYPGSGCPGSGSCPASVPFITKFNSAGSLIYSTYLGAGNENSVNGIASSGTDIYVMVAEPANGLQTGGAYDADNSGGQKELIVRVSDAQPMSTTITVGAQTAPTDSSAQTVSLTSTLSASSTVNGGVVTYTVTNSGSTQIGSPVTSGIVAGNVTPATSYTLPGNTPAATYTITASYRAAENFLDSTGTANLVTGGVPTVGVTIASSPTGLTFSSSGTGCAPGSYTAPMTLQWTPASSCTVAYTTPQAGSAGVQYAFSQWEDSSTSASRSITAPATTTTYTATFLTQYQLTIAAATGGSATPASGQFYNSGTVVNLQATASGGYAFSSWTGSTVASASSAATTITLTGPASVTANFSVGTTIASSPSGLSFSVTGTGCAPGSYTSPMTLQWIPASSCTVTYTTPQAESAGIRYAFSLWENASTNASRVITALSSATTYTATFNTQYQLTTANAPSAAGSITPASLQFYNSGTVVNLQATANSGFVFGSWTGTVANAANAATTITLNGPATVTANFNVNVSIASVPSGLSFGVTGAGCAAGAGLSTPQTLVWTPGSSCTVTFATPQAASAGMQYAFSQWENSSTNAARVITAPTAVTTYTATLTTQYQLTTAALPSPGGSITPASGQFYNSGTVVNLQATANPGFAFNTWTGTVANAASASTTITLTGPASVTANFNPGITISSAPAGLSFSVTGTGCAAGSYATPQVLSWVPASSCTVAFATPQAGVAGTRYAFSQWENNSTSASRAITAPASGTTYTATFLTQYLLTTAVSPSLADGSIAPATGYVNSGTVVAVSATAHPGFLFTSFSGGLSSSTNPQNITVSAPVTVTAGFSAKPASVSASVGSPQSATANTAFGTALQALVKDGSDNPLSGVTVTFTAPGSGAGGSFPGGQSTATALTNGSGIATAPVFTANTIAGTYLISASVSGVVTGANFSLTNLAGPAASVAPSVGSPQTATINTAFSAVLQALVKDASNNPVSGVTVTFTAPGSGAGGSFAGGQPVATAVTNGSGIATAPVFTANTIAGPYLISASVAGVPTGTTFSLTNLAGPAASVAPSVGSPQTALVGTAFTTALQAAVADASGNPVNGAPVTFTILSAGGASGSFAGPQSMATVNTNTSGIATAPMVTANANAGLYTVTAAVPGVALAASFALSNSVLATPVVTPQSLSFSGNFGDSTPIPAQNVTITTAAGAAFTLTSSATWLTATGSAGGISVTASMSGLAAGAYSGSIAIAFSNGQTASIQASLMVVGLPVLVTDQASLTFAYNGSSPPPAQQFLLGAQNRNTNFALSVGAPWITATSTRSQTPATIVVTVNPAGTPAGSYPGSVVVTSPGSPNSPLTIPVTLVIASTTSTGPTTPTTPTINPGGLLNASNFLTESGAPDTIITAFGNIPCSAPEVLLNGQAAEVIGSTATLVSFTLPASVAGESSVNVQIGCNNVISLAITLPLAQTAPGIFTLPQNGSGPGAVLNVDERVNSAANPASRGSYVAIFVTGFGLFNAPSSDGLSRLSLPVTAFFGGVQGTVVYAGEAPGLTPGLQQINVMIPAGAPTGPAVPLSLSVGGNTTQPGVTVAIQ